MRKILWVFVPVILLTVGPAIDVKTLSQQTTAREPLGKLSGLILDPGKACVPKAKIVVERDGFRREGMSADDGSYEIELPVNSYTVTATRDGFHPAREADVQIRADGVTSLNVVMKGIHSEENIFLEELSTESAVPNNSVNRLCLKVRNRSWIGSVQRAVATWSVITMRIS